MILQAKAVSSVKCLVESVVESTSSRYNLRNNPQRPIGEMAADDEMVVAWNEPVLR